MAITMNWPHSYATIIRNTANTPLDVPWLGRHGLLFKPNETMVFIGDPLLVANHMGRYDGRKSIINLAKTIARGQLEVLSRPNGPNEGTNTTVPVVDTNGNMLPNCRLVVL